MLYVYVRTQTHASAAATFFIKVEVLKRERKKIVTINSHVKENCLQSREQPYYLCWVLYAVQRDCVLTVWNVLCVHYYNKLFIFLRSFLRLIGKNRNFNSWAHIHARAHPVHICTRSAYCHPIVYIIDLHCECARNI